MICFLTSAPPLDTETYTYTDENGFLSGIKAALGNRSKTLFICSDPDTVDRTELFAGRVSDCFERSGVHLWRAVLDGRNKQHAAELVRQAEFIVLEGGHVPTQNRFFADIALKELLKDFGGVLMGVSAGSMNSASTVYAHPEHEGEAVDPDYKRFLPGLGLTSVMMLPHYSEIKDDVLDGLRVFEDIAYPDSIGRRFYALNDGSYILVKDGSEQIRGEAFLIENGVLTRISSSGDVVLI